MADIHGHSTTEACAEGQLAWETSGVLSSARILRELEETEIQVTFQC